MSLDGNGKKVFCIGFHRTGTTTFQTALEELGYKVVGMRKSEWDAYATGNYEQVIECIKQFDGFRDMPWPLMYQWLYEAYPDAQFVLSRREPTPWVASCVGNYKDRPYEMFPVIYGFEVFEGNEEVAKRVYRKHLEDVRAFFKDKPGKLLDIDFTKESRWQPLCEFLGEPVPDRSFPHANKRPTTLWSRIYLKSLKAMFPNYYRRIARDKK